MNKDTVSKLIRLARAHDAMVERKGYKADADTDSSSRAYNEARAAASPEELEAFEAVYF